MKLHTTKQDVIDSLKYTADFLVRLKKDVGKTDFSGVEQYYRAIKALENTEIEMPELTGEGEEYTVKFDQCGVYVTFTVWDKFWNILKESPVAFVRF